MKSNRIRDLSIEVAVGAFLLAILLALGLFTIVISRESLFRPTYSLDIEFKDVMGIREGDNVFLRGVAVGKIRQITVEESAVRVRAAVDRPIELRTDYAIEILPSSVLGGRYLNIYRGSDDAPMLPEDAPIVGITPVDLVDQGTRAIQALRETLEGEDGILVRLGTTMEHMQDLSDRLSRGEGTIGKLLTEDTVYENMEAISADLRTVTARLASGESSLGRLLNDDGRIYENIETMTADLRAVSARIEAGEGLLGKLTSEEDTVYEDLQVTMRSIREISETIVQGEGTLGRLAKDPALYDDARLLIQELRSTLDDFRETAPLTTFSSVFFGAF